MSAYGLSLPSVITQRPDQSRADWMPFAFCLLLSFVFRTAYFFTSTDGYLRDAAMTYHDEAIFMQVGSFVLSGHLPYIEKWDVLLPAGWFSWALIMLLSGGELIAVRVLAALCVAVTGYVCFRMLSDMGMRRQGWLAALLYVALASGLQVSQSFTYEQLIALPFALFMYMMLHPKEGRQRYVMAGVVAYCAWLHHGFLWLLPAVACFYPQLYRGAAGMPLWVGALTRLGVLSVIVLGGYFVLFLVYLFHGETDVYLRSLMDAQAILFGWPVHFAVFVKRYFYKMLHQPVWLISVGLLAYVMSCLKRVVFDRIPMQRVDHLCLLFVLLGFAALHGRGNHSAGFMFYMISVLPAYVLVLALVTRFEFGQLRVFAILTVLLGLYHILTPAIRQSISLMRYAAGDKAYEESFLGDRLYQAVQLMGGTETDRDTLIVCGEDDMLYPLTGLKNPRYFFFPFYSYNPYLQRVLKHDKLMLKEHFTDHHPLYIVGRAGDPLTESCFGEINTEINSHYVQIANIKTTIVLMRRTSLKPYLPKTE